jgi:hypothetical protein
MSELEEVLSTSLAALGIAPRLSAPNRLLGGERPSDLLAQGREQEVLRAGRSFPAGDYI